MLDLNNFSDDQEDLRGITKPLIKHGKNGKLNSIDVTAFQLSDALDARRWRLKGNMQVTAEPRCPSPSCRSNHAQTRSPRIIAMCP